MNVFRRFFKGLSLSILWRLLGLILILLISLALYLRIVLGFGWANWTGFEDKKLWDWFELLIIPLVLAVVGILFTRAENSTEREIAQNQLEENILSSYIDKIEDILANVKGENIKNNPELVRIIEGKTSDALRRLNIIRREILIRFLSDRNILESIHLIHVDLNDANLSSIDFTDAKLRGEFQRTGFLLTSLQRADFYGSDFTDANFRISFLEGSNLRGTKLVRANFSVPFTMSPDGSNLEGANLEMADLQDANLYGTNLQNVNQTRKTSKR